MLLSWSVNFLSQIGQTPISSQHAGCCNFLLGFLKAKCIELQTHRERFVSAAGHNKQSLYLVFIALTVILIMLFTTKNFIIFNYQLEEEAGSAEEQPASNKADAYTIVKGS
jgi:hypothetical protein